MFGYAIILISLTVLAWLRPYWGVVFLYGLLPTYLMRTQIGAIPTNVLELGTYLIALIVLYHFVRNTELRISFIKKLKWLYFENRSVLWVFAFFVVAMALAAIFTVDLRTSAGIFKGWIFDPILAGALVLAVVQNKKQIYGLIASLSTMISVLTLYGMSEYFFFPPTVFPNYQVRLDSIFTSPNYHALLAGPVIAMGAGLLLLGFKLLSKKLKIILASTSIINLAGFYLTYSYGGYIGIVAAALFVILGSYLLGRKNKKVTASAFGVLAVVLVITGVAVYQSPKFKRDFGNMEGVSALRGRMEIWQTSWTAIQNHPIAGFGLGNFEHAYNRYVYQALERPPLESLVIRAHNIYLNIWLEAGILGLMSFLALLVIAFKLFSKVKNSSLATSWGLAAGMITIAIHGLFDTPYFKNDLSYLFWFIMASLILLNYQDSRVKAENYGGNADRLISDAATTAE